MSHPAPTAPRPATGDRLLRQLVTCALRRATAEVARSTGGAYTADPVLVPASGRRPGAPGEIALASLTSTYRDDYYVRYFLCAEMAPAEQMINIRISTHTERVADIELRTLGDLAALRATVAHLCLG